MIEKFRILSLCFFMVCKLVFCQSQKTPDTLLQKSFDYLESQFKANAVEPNKALPYVETYLEKAKQEQLDSVILKGYFLYAYISDFETALAYCDSIIAYDTTENRLLSTAHDEKGYLYSANGKYKKALESYLEARKISKTNNNIQVLITSTYSIGVIKSLIGQKEEALEIYKEQLENFNDDALKTKFSNIYLENLFSLADSYTTNSKLDSATIYNKIGIQESLRMEELSYYPRFILGDGITRYTGGSYQRANDSLSKAIKLLQQIPDSSALAIGYYFKAKIQEQLGDLAATIELLKNAATLASKQSIQPDYLPIFESLYENYKKTDSIEKQLVYLEKFIAYNKKLESEFNGIDATLYTQYDIPELLDAKEAIITGLQEKDKISQRNIFLLSVFLTGFGILSFYYYRKRVIYKRRYDTLFQKEFESKQTYNAKSKVSKLAKIPSEVIEELLPKIEEFEKNKDFLDSSLTLNKMAKQLKSNSNYLSKTINHTKNKNFSSYISDLRINYMIEELKTNSKLLNYTIKAIASEAGFGNTESFTKAFYAKTHLYPSYFIKQLKKEQ